jgi:hypothetical protein
MSEVDLGVLSLTLFIVILTGLGVIVAWNQLTSLNAHQRRDTFMRLLGEMTSKEARANRAILHQNIPNSSQLTPSVTIKAYVDAGRDNNATSDQKELKDAIEETIVLIDRIGYFLLRDPSLIDKAPGWVWTITAHMWQKLGEYVKYREVQEQSSEWGKYFKALAVEANKQLGGTHASSKQS